MRERDAYESKNLGGFRKSFPNDDPVSKMLLTHVVVITKI
jgi:hypothetical protein